MPQVPGWLAVTEALFLMIITTASGDREASLCSSGGFAFFVIPIRNLMVIKVERLTNVIPCDADKFTGERK